MGKFTQNLKIKFLVISLAVVGLSHSATADIAAKSDAGLVEHKRVLVFGKFRLVKNEYESRLGPGFFGNTAALTLLRIDDQEEMTIRVGKDGAFSRKLSPGDYYLMGIEFKHQGNTIETDTNYLIRIGNQHEANYLGTITLMAEFKSGYNGIVGKIDRFLVTNDCAEECKPLLADIDMTGLTMTTALPVWQTHVAYTQ